MTPKFDADVVPDDPWSVGSLGSTLQSFHPTMHPLVFGAIMTPFIFAACWGVVTVLTEPRFGEAAFGILQVFIATFVGGIGFFLFWPTTAWQVHLCEGGFYYDRLWTRRIFPWKEIREVRQYIDHRYKSPAEQKAGRPFEINVGFMVTTVGDQSFGFGHNREPWAGTLERALRDAAAQRGFDWKVIESHHIDF